MWFEPHSVALSCVQAACVALPAAGLPAWLERFRGRAWALVLPLSIAVVVAVIAVLPASADAFTWIALLLVPPGCALALGWASHGARPPLALLAAPLLVLAWAFQGRAAGDVATTLLVAGSAVTLGRLLAGAAPLTLLKAGVIAMAAVDAYLVFSNKLEAPNAVLIAAKPGLGLPQLQSAQLSGASLGYGDFFAAAVTGGILAMERAHQVRAALATLVLALCWDQLFAFYDVLPATIPPALVLIARELARAQQRWRGPQPAGGAPSEVEISSSA
jgi:hypothetical protein